MSKGCCFSAHHSGLKPGKLELESSKLWALAGIRLKVQGFRCWGSFGATLELLQLCDPEILQQLYTINSSTLWLVSSVYKLSDFNVTVVQVDVLGLGLGFSQAR